MKENKLCVCGVIVSCVWGTFDIEATVLFCGRFGALVIFPIVRDLVTSHTFCIFFLTELFKIGSLHDPFFLEFWNLHSKQITLKFNIVANGKNENMRLRHKDEKMRNHST